MPSRQFSSPAWFWKQLCQNWTLSTKCFDVDESVNSNENLFSQNFSDQIYFLLLPRLFTHSQTFCVASGKGFLLQPSWLQSSGTAQHKLLPTRVLPFHVPRGKKYHSSQPPSPSIAELHPDPCCFVVGTKVPSRPFYSIITPEKVKHREITIVIAALKVWPGQYDAWLHTKPRVHNIYLHVLSHTEAIEN